jgi:hypothetical protein
MRNAYSSTPSAQMSCAAARFLLLHLLYEIGVAEGDLGWETNTELDLPAMAAALILLVIDVDDVSSGGPGRRRGASRAGTPRWSSWQDARAFTRDCSRNFA